MKQISFTELGEKIEEIFITQEKYKFAKYIQEFLEGETFLADYWTFYMFESLKDKAPVIYSVITPYDTVSKKSPEQAIVFENGKIILNIDCLEYVNMRTGIMDSLVLKNIGVNTLADKKVLYFGTGNVAKMSLKALKEFFPDVTEVSVINKRGNDDEFVKLAKSLGISVVFTSKNALSEFDFIFCHTSSGAGHVLEKEDLAKIKKGAVITTFVSVPGDTELAKEFFDTSKATVIIDWPESIDGTKELKEAVDQGFAEKEKILTLEQLFKNNNIYQQEGYTLYRSTGTPMQNLAFLKLLLNK